MKGRLPFEPAALWGEEWCWRRDSVVTGARFSAVVFGEGVDAGDGQHGAVSSER
jgi:hypothetical protein